MLTRSDILFDKDVAKLAGLSADAFQRRVRNGFHAGEIDFNQADPITMGKRRVWIRADVERVIKGRVKVATEGGEA